MGKQRIPREGLAGFEEKPRWGTDFPGMREGRGQPYRVPALRPSPTGVWCQHSFPISLPTPQVSPSHPPANYPKLLSSDSQVPSPWLCSCSAFHLQGPTTLIQILQGRVQPLPWSHCPPLCFIYISLMVIHSFIHSLIRQAFMGHLSVPGTVPGARDRQRDQTQFLLSRSSWPWSYQVRGIIVTQSVVPTRQLTPWGQKQHPVYLRRAAFIADA